MFKILILLFVSLFSVNSFSEISSNKKTQIKIGSPPQHYLKSTTEPGRLDTYVILAESIVLPKSEKFTCKNNAAFWQWYKATNLGSLGNSDYYGHIFAYAAQQDCKEVEIARTTLEGYKEVEVFVQFTPQSGLWAYDQVGNMILENYVAKANQTLFAGVALHFQAPLHVISHFGIIVQTQEGIRATASFFTESKKGFEAQNTYNEIKKLDSLLLTIDKREAIEKYFNGRVKDNKELVAVLDLAPTATSIWFLADNIPEYVDKFNRSVFPGWFFDEDSTPPQYKATYTCNKDSGCIKN